MDDAELLNKYVTQRSQEAFALLVERYVDMVFSAARRQVRDAALAEDVTQAVFIVLAKKAARLRRDRSIAGWLMQVTRYAAVNAARKRSRQEHHEQRAAMAQNESHVEPDRGQWNEYSPLLDEGIAKLREHERGVLVMRYFQRKTSREVAAELGISEAAAEKRATRAVEKLRDFFRRRGVTVSGAAIASGLLANSVEAAPVALKGTIGASAASAGLGAGSIAKGAVVTMACAKTKAAVIAAATSVLVIGGGVVTVKALQTPDRQTIDVPVEVTSGPATAPNKTTPWSVRFSGGTRVELIGVTNTPGKPDGWWKGDGSPAAAMPKPPRVIGQFNAPGHAVYQLIFRQHPNLAAPKDAHVNVEVDVPTAGSTSTTVSPTAGGEINLMAAVERGLRNLPVTLSCPTGQYQEDWRYPIAAPRDPAAKQPADVSIGKIYEKGGKVQIEIKDRRRPPGNWQLQMCVLDAAGKSTAASSITSSMFGPSVYEFDVRQKDVAALLSRSRPMEIHRIGNISLRPLTAAPTTAP